MAATALWAGEGDPLPTLPAFVGRGSPSPDLRAAPGSPRPRLVLRANGPPNRSPSREAASTVFHLFAAASAAFSARSLCSSLRSSLTSLPVSIPTGQASWQEPSAAQVSSESYWY